MFKEPIYIRRSAVSADSTYIYIPEWKVKIIKPGSIKNFAYAFDGQKLYFYGTASDVDANGASGDVAFGNIEGTYIGYLEVETNQTWKEEFSIFEIDDEQFLRYYTNEKVNDATGNEAYIKLRDGTTTEFRDHFGDTRTYLNFEANDED